ncbi:MAG: glutathione S-transferase N-terminal domain-containing protein [Bauldia sp.]
MTAKQTQPIDLYYWGTPNGFKISILLEELGLPYTPHFVNIGKGDQFKPEFLAIAPNNRIPAIVDPEGPDGKPISIFESAAIMIYLAEKFGRFLGRNPRERVAVLEWLEWQMGGVGPMFGQYGHFRNAAPEKIPYALTRYGNEVHRLYRVLNTRLEGREYVADEYSIADMALFGWVRNWQNREVDGAEFPNVVAWSNRLEARPAVQRGIALKAPPAPESKPEEKEAERKILYGQR